MAKRISAADTGDVVSHEQVQARLTAIVKRRNRIAHEADRDVDSPGRRNPITDGATTETIDWIERMAAAILAVLGPPPASGDVIADQYHHRPLGGQGKQPRPKWTRRDIEEALARIDDQPSREAAQRLLAHADAHGALFRGGVSAEPSAGLYYWLQGERRSLWSLYLAADRPQIVLNFGSVWPRDAQLARRMIAEIRRVPALDAALLHPDDAVVRKYPGIDLTALGQSPDGADAVIAALDLIDQAEHRSTGNRIEAGDPSQSSRRASIPDRLVAHRALTDGQSLTIFVPDGIGEDRDAIETWLHADPSRNHVRWRNDPRKPFEWPFDGNTYSMAGLIRSLIKHATGQDPRTGVWGPNCIQTADGTTLVRLAKPLD